MVVRVVTLPVKVTYWVGKAGVRTGYAAGRLSVGSTYKVGRFVGVSRLLALGAGVGIGLLVAPTSGHLPQPSVEVSGGVAILSGGAPHETGKADIERAAAAVPGVAEVESHLVVGATGNGDTTA